MHCTKINFFKMATAIKVPCRPIVLVYKKVLLDEILVQGMTVNCFRMYCSFTMADFMCISVVLWGICADGHDEIKKKKKKVFGSCQLFLPLCDLLNSYPLSLCRSNVRALRHPTVLMCVQNLSRPPVAATSPFPPFRRAVDICATSLGIQGSFACYRFTCYSLARKIYWATSRIMIELKAIVAVSVPTAQCLIWDGW